MVVETSGIVETHDTNATTATTTSKHTKRHNHLPSPSP